MILPLTALGLAYTRVDDSIRIARLMLLGAIGTYLFALVLPEYEGELDDVRVEFWDRVGDTLLGVAIAYLGGSGSRRCSCVGAPVR